MSTKNPHLKNIERAPYEIANLLVSLPEDFTAYDKKHSADVHLRIEAVEKHAANAKSTLLSGLEAIGKTMSVAALNDSCEPDRSTISDLGDLIHHLAVEVQFLAEMEEECAGLRREAEAFAAKKGGAK